MAESTYKILAVERILKQNPYGVTVNEILSLLEIEYGIEAERKSIYSNIAVLSRFMQIDKFKGNDGKIYWCTKEGVEQ